MLIWIQADFLFSSFLMCEDFAIPCLLHLETQACPRMKRPSKVMIFFFFSFRLKWAIIPVFSITRRGNMYCLYSNFIIQSHFGQISSLISSQKVFATRTWMLDDRLIAISPRILYETVLLDISANYHLRVDSFARSLVKRSLNLLLL